MKWKRVSLWPSYVKNGNLIVKTFIDIHQRSYFVRTARRSSVRSFCIPVGKAVGSAYGIGAPALPPFLATGKKPRRGARGFLFGHSHVLALTSRMSTGWPCANTERRPPFFSLKLVRKNQSCKRWFDICVTICIFFFALKFWRTEGRRRIYRARWMCVIFLFHW